MRLPLLAVAASLTMSGLARADAPSTTSPVVDPAYLPYQQPGILAKIPNGQTIHVTCMGTGSPAVILTAGAGNWSAVWRKVQPEVAKTTRVCAWDRPGVGFSSGTTRPQTVLNTTADLEAALKAARVRAPFVIVGHSLGGYEALLFKDRNPKSTTGMVLVDPSIPDQTKRMEKAAPEFSRFVDTFHARLMQYLARCLDGVKSGKLKPGGEDPEGCLKSPKSYPPQLTMALASRDTDPLRFGTLMSLFQNFDLDDRLVADAKRRYGDMPLVVLTASKLQSFPPGSPQAAIDQAPAYQAEWARAHAELAALSSRGLHRRVADATHYIQDDQPRAVIEAIEQVVADARARAREKPTAKHR